MAGKLYGIGVGPGDSELLTLKGKRILDNAQIIAYPVKEKGEESTALNIIKMWWIPRVKKFWNWCFG